MLEALAWTTAAWLLLVAFALLALLQDRHRQRVLATCKPASRRGVAAFCATSLMLGSLAVCVASQGTAYGILAWSMLTSFAALAVALCLAACPVLLRPFLLVGAAQPAGDARSTFRPLS